MHVSLHIKKLDEADLESHYILRVTDDNSDSITEIPLITDTPTSGMLMQKWKLSTRKRDKGKRVIGVYFLVSIMGHELDQWRYYDLDLGIDVTK